MATNFRSPDRMYDDVVRTSIQRAQHRTHRDVPAWIVVGEIKFKVKKVESSTLHCSNVYYDVRVPEICRPTSP